MKLPPEDELLKGCLRADPYYQRILYSRYNPYMMGLCHRYIRDLDTAKDIVQEGFVKIFLQLHTFKGHSSLKTWMGRIIINTALEFLRKEKKNQVFMELMPEHEDAADEQQDSGDGWNELEPEQVLELMHQLPLGYRTVLNMYAVDGYSHAEIAAQLGISEGTSKSQLSKARVFLKQLIKKKLNINSHETNLRQA